MANSAKQLRSKRRWGIVGLVALLIISVLYDLPAQSNTWIDTINNSTGIGIPQIPEKDFSLGLDLQGGAHLIYQANVSELEGEERSASIEGVRDVIERRVNAFGVGEPNVQSSKVGDDYRIIVELPGVTDISAAISRIGETPILEFKEESNEPARDLNEEELTEIISFNADAQARAQAVLDDILAGADFAETAGEKSEDPTAKANNGYVGFISKDNTQYGAVYDWADQAEDGDITEELIDGGNAFYIAKRTGEQEGESEVRASHILVCYLGSSRCNAQFTKDEARARAEDLFNQANASNFEELASTESNDPTAAAQGGDLGFFTRVDMVPEFADVVFGIEVGEIAGPLETEFGFHVVYKTDEKPSKEYEISAIAVAQLTASDVLPQDANWKNTGLSGKQLERAEVLSDPTTGAIQVSLEFDNEGRQLFRELTERNINKQIAIFLDGEPISIPSVTSVIPDGRAVITGNFTLDAARLLSQRLNAGALPVPIELISQQSVGASLGAESLSKSLNAGIVAIIIVMIFMVLYYRLPGALSVFALTLYIALALAIFKLIGVTLTLAGIAGFILSIGMAVDANVLIFERLKEELLEGKTLKRSVKEGFERAWTSIRDGNISTLITCFLLVMFGSSFVKGFAITLGIGVVLSMFSAITVTRTLLTFAVPLFKNEANGMFLGAKKTKKE